VLGIGVREGGGVHFEVGALVFTLCAGLAAFNAELAALDLVWRQRNLGEGD